jgi:hypothetical protein
MAYGVSLSDRRIAIKEYHVVASDNIILNIFCSAVLIPYAAQGKEKALGENSED